jgi:hypothetical protein
MNRYNLLRFFCFYHVGLSGVLLVYFWYNSYKKVFVTVTCKLIMIDVLKKGGLKTIES